MVVVGICLAGRSSMFQTLWSQVLTPRVTILESGHAEILDKNSQIMSFICPSEKAIPRGWDPAGFPDLDTLYLFMTGADPPFPDFLPLHGSLPESYSGSLPSPERGTETGYLISWGFFLELWPWYPQQLSPRLWRRDRALGTESQQQMPTLGLGNPRIVFED